MGNKYRDFYTNEYAAGNYGGSDELSAKDKRDYKPLQNFIKKHKIREKNGKCLEIGSGKGVFQDLVKDYTGLDYSESVEKYYHKPFISGSALELPFASESYDYMWSCAVWEHIPNPEKALNEAMRVLRNGGGVLFSSGMALQAMGG